MMNHTVTLRDGKIVPALGQGTWCLGEHRDLLEQEEKALRAGIDAGMTLLDTEDMEELWRIPNGNHCAANQVLYHIASRGIEYDLLPWVREHHVPLMAYCPLAQAGGLRRGLYHNRLLQEIAGKNSATISQILLAFVIRDGHTIAIPRTGKPSHTIENAGADAIDLTEDELREISRIFPAPTHKTELDMQ